MSITAMKQALEALEYPGPSWPDGRERAAQALRTAIAEAEKRHHCPEWDFLEITKDDPEFEACLCFSQKPDAWVADVGEPPTEEEKQEPVATYTCGVCGVSMRMESPAAQRQWVGLTTEDMVTCINEPAWDLILRKAEQILREKNQ